MSVYRYEKKTSMSMSMISTVMKLLSKVLKKTLLEQSLTSKNIDSFVTPRLKNKDINIEVEKQCLLNTISFEYKNRSSKSHIIYLHGGAYITNGGKIHYKFIKNLVSQTKGIVTYIDYPLAPTSHFLETIEKTLETINTIMSNNLEDNFYLMGDSAGGGLSLSMYSLLEEKNIKQVFLISPWLDLSMTNPKIEDIENNDFMLNKEVLIDCARKYVGIDDLKTKEASPIYKSLDDSSKINIYTGTYDILYPDIMKFETDNPDSFLYEFPKLPHVFPIISNNAEQKAVIKHIVSKISY